MDTLGGDTDTLKWQIEAQLVAITGFGGAVSA